MFKIEVTGKKFLPHSTGSADWVGATEAIVNLGQRIDAQHVKQCGYDVF